MSTHPFTHAGEWSSGHDWRAPETGRDAGNVARTRKLVTSVAAVGAVYFFGLVVFERLAPRRVVRAYQRLNNPRQAPLMGVLPGFGVVETIGRRTGIPRQAPVGGRLRHNTFWLVAGDGRHSAFVKNIEADPRVRVRVHGRWRDGRASVLDDDDPVRRLLTINPINSLFVLLANPRQNLLTVRIDLEA